MAYPQGRPNPSADVLNNGRSPPFARRTHVVYYGGMTNAMRSDELITVLSGNIRRRRMELGLTQQQLANRLGVHPPYISDLERGKRTPLMVNLAPLATALETPPHALLMPRV